MENGKKTINQFVAGEFYIETFRYSLFKRLSSIAHSARTKRREMAGENSSQEINNFADDRESLIRHDDDGQVKI